MQEFYNRLNQYLLAAGLEICVEPVGATDAEIDQWESIYKVHFPLAYRQFLRWCGNGRMEWMDNQDFRLQSLPYSWESAADLLTENREVLETSGFVIAEWQGYNFWYLLLGEANPIVKLCIIKDDNPNTFGLDVTSYGRFTDWLIGQIKASVKIRKSLQRIDINVSTVWIELDSIAQLANT